MEALRIVQKMVWGPWLLGLFLAVESSAWCVCGDFRSVISESGGERRLGAAGKDSF
ncbi:MAG: hypothetical protein ACLR3S_04835 [Clostridium fessum]